MYKTHECQLIEVTLVTYSALHYMEWNLKEHMKPHIVQKSRAALQRVHKAKKALDEQRDKELNEASSLLEKEGKEGKRYFKGKVQIKTDG